VSLLAIGRLSPAPTVIIRADGDHPLLHHPVRTKISGNRVGAALGQGLVVLVRAHAVGMAGDFDHRLVVLRERLRDVVQHRGELRLQRRAVEIEGDVAGHVEGDVVALAHHVDAGAGHAAAQLGFLSILVGADPGTRESADTCAHQRALAAFDGIIAAEQANRRADGRADQGATLGAVRIVGRVGLAGVGGAAGRQHRDGRSREAELEGGFHPRLLGESMVRNGPEYVGQAKHATVAIG
jgi:hypothetical protein